MYDDHARGGEGVSSTSSGNFLLVEERTPDFAYMTLNDAAIEGRPALVITRDYPSDVRKRYSISDAPIVWLTHIVGNDCIDPTSLGLMLSRITGFIERNRTGIVLLDGIEYLISQNGFDRILHFVHQVRDLVIVGGGTIIMPLDMRVLDEKQLALLERNLEVIVPSSRLGGKRFVFELEDGQLKMMNRQL